ncbi:hypothetical protein C5O24_12795 [Paramuribaculum intestinale]|nr:hypothetical protein C5O24_12795 [Paramuribaculum intestinale]DAJ73661.1 MAG TPA: hypothetical protein [Caudoviricetes sp.]
MPKPLAPAFQPLPFPYSPVLRDAMAEVSRSVEPMLDDLVARYAPTNEGRVTIALCDVKNSHGRARRDALRRLDRVVTELFPPVEGAPLPSEELNGKPDVLAGAACIGYDFHPESNTFGIGFIPSGYAPFNSK